MLFELRCYDIVPGRVADELALVHAVACAPAPSADDGADRRSLWEKAGISLRGMWLIATGERLPRLCYLLAWENAADRERGFPAFWADPDWRALRGKSAGLLVERIEDWLLFPWTAWLGALDDPNDPVPRGIHEMRFIRSTDGHGAAAERVLDGEILSHVRVNAGRVLGAFEISVGARLPASVLFLAWPSFEAHRRAWAKLQAVGAVVEAPTGQAKIMRGAKLILSMEHYLMEPVSFAVPRPNLGVTPQPAQNRR